MSKKNSGWPGESQRHAMSARGISTKDLQKLDRIQMNDWEGTISLYFHPSLIEIQEQIDWADEIRHNFNTGKNTDIQTQLEQYSAEQELSMKETAEMNKRLQTTYIPGDKTVSTVEILYIITGKWIDIPDIDDTPEVVLKADHDHPDTWSERSGTQTKVHKVVKNKFEEEK